MLIAFSATPTNWEEMKAQASVLLNNTKWSASLNCFFLSRLQDCRVGKIGSSHAHLTDCLRAMARYTDCACMCNICNMTLYSSCNMWPLN